FAPGEQHDHAPRDYSRQGATRRHRRPHPHRPHPRRSRCPKQGGRQAVKLTEIGALAALEEVARNGMLWTCRSYEAPQIWANLRRRGWVEKDPWTGRMRPSPAGRAALSEGGKP